jgi:hypothetical protein
MTLNNETSVNKKLESMWNEVFWPSVRYSHESYQEVKRKTTKTVGFACILYVVMWCLK